jgi:hypothetical protein
MKSSIHSLIPFLPLFCSCQSRRLDSIKFPCFQAHIPVGCRPETRLLTLDYCSMLPNTSLYPLCTDHIENTASIVKEVYLLIRSLAVLLLLCAFACAGMCLPSRCLAIGIHIAIIIITSTAHSQMRLPTAIGEPSSATSIGVPSNSLQLTRSGRRITFLCDEMDINTSIKRSFCEVLRMF